MKDLNRLSLSRRKALKFTLVPILAELLPSSFVLASERNQFKRVDNSYPDDLSDRLLEAYPFTEQSMKLGEAYLTLHPQLNQKRIQSKVLSREALFGELMNSNPSNQITTVLRKEIQQGFFNGETTMIEGWCFSNLELELCALAHLRNSAVK